MTKEKIIQDYKDGKITGAEFLKLRKKFNSNKGL